MNETTVPRFCDPHVLKLRTSRLQLFVGANNAELGLELFKPTEPVRRCGYLTPKDSAEFSRPSEDFSFLAGCILTQLS